MNKYEPVIGLEIHAELKTKSKMFCSCKNNPFSSKQNENVCPICLGMPGTLPVLNQQAIDWTIMTGLVVNCKISEFTKWDRKNYFYPDLPKGYQISQYDLPICENGYLEVTTSNLLQPLVTVSNRKIRITRIHLEEDTGTLKHPEGRAEVDYSLADYNRAGVPLMELVTEPDIQSGQEAKEFCQKYQSILRTLGVSDADMEKGQMRCEANISIRPKGSKKLGTKVEVKNLNSFKAVERAIKYEIERQAELLEFGEKVVQETRGWDDAKGKTYTMRVKETSADYRYFPEPDLPPVTISEASIKKIEASIPEMPDEKSIRYIKNYNLNKSDAEILISDFKKAKYFEECLILNTKYKIPSSKIAAWIINEVPNLDIEPETLVELVSLVEKGEISGKIAKEVLPEIKKGKKPSEIIKEKGLKQISNTSELENIIKNILSQNSDAVEKIISGKTGVMGFLVGQVMRETKGQANPKIVNEIIRNMIK
jgi:aspartyl-tRNA(Asn)/glutamyl-tRNA(Gln) amidotransferase subunit B